MFIGLGVPECKSSVTVVGSVWKWKRGSEVLGFSGTPCTVLGELLWTRFIHKGVSCLEKKLRARDS